MDVFKLRPEDDGSIRLTEQNYRRATGNEAPWVTEGEGRPAYYAVCPNCNNPIAVVNLNSSSLRDERSRPNLQARHIKRDVECVAQFNQEAYDNCFLAEASAFTDVPTKRKPGDFSQELLTILVEEADAVKSFMELAMGISIPQWLFSHMLEKFVALEGYLHRSVGKLNLPYAVLFMAQDQLIAPKRDACCVKKVKNPNSSPFIPAIERSEYFEIGSFEKIMAKKSAPMGVSLSFSFNRHILPQNANEPQIMNMVIEEACNGEKRILAERKIQFDLHYFYNTVAKRRSDRKTVLSILQPIIDGHSGC